MIEYLEFKVNGNNEKCKIEGIYKSRVYTKKSEVGYFLGF